jgi:hypothetical protein
VARTAAAGGAAAGGAAAVGHASDTRRCGIIAGCAYADAVYAVRAVGGGCVAGRFAHPALRVVGAASAVDKMMGAGWARREAALSMVWYAESRRILRQRFSIRCNLCSDFTISVTAPNLATASCLTTQEALCHGLVTARWVVLLRRYKSRCLASKLEGIGIARSRAPPPLPPLITVWPPPPPCFEPACTVARCVAAQVEGVVE